MSLSSKQIKLQKQMLSGFQFGLFKFLKVPMAFLAGVKLKELTENRATTSVKYKHLNTNPFKSIYFAILAMTAELATGALALFSIAKYEESIAVLVVESRGQFMKKATGEIRFECADGERFATAIKQCVETKEPVQLKAKAVGKNEQDEVVCEYEFTWSFKVRSS